MILTPQRQPASSAWWCVYTNQDPLYWFRTTQKTHPSSRTPHKISRGLCCNCISVDSLPNPTSSTPLQCCTAQENTCTQIFTSSSVYWRIWPHTEWESRDVAGWQQKKASKELMFFLSSALVVKYHIPDLLIFSPGVGETLPVQSRFLIYLYTWPYLVWLHWDEWNTFWYFNWID